MTARLHYLEYGDGPPVYILHGLFGSSRNWNSIARQLADRYHVTLVDLRNHGDSEHAGSMTYPEMAEDIAGLMSARGHSAVNMLGHSMGGKTAMVLALKYPALIGRLLVVDIAPVAYTPDYDNLLAAMQRLPVDRLTARKEADEILSKNIPDGMLRQFLLQNLIRSETGFKWRINLDAIQHNLHHICSFPREVQDLAYFGPGRFLAGGDSDYILPVHQPIISGLFPGADIRTIDNAGHWIHADRPDVFVRETLEFLEQGQ